MKSNWKSMPNLGDDPFVDDHDEEQSLYHNQQVSNGTFLSRKTLTNAQDWLSKSRNQNK